MNRLERELLEEISIVRMNYRGLCEELITARNEIAAARREALDIAEQAKRFIHGNESVFGGHPEYDQGWQGACDHIAERLRLAFLDDGWVPTHRHVKTGGLYRILARGKLRWDLTEAVVYQAKKDGSVWVRPASEFDDGRFIAHRLSAEQGGF